MRREGPAVAGADTRNPERFPHKLAAMSLAVAPSLTLGTASLAAEAVAHRRTVNGRPLEYLTLERPGFRLKLDFSSEAAYSGPDKPVPH
jgi:hypothetical protein